MKKNLFFLALIFLLVGAGCEEVGKLSGEDNENLEKTVVEQDLSKTEAVTNTEKMEAEDSKTEESSEIKLAEKKSAEKMESEDDDEDNEFEDEDGEDDDDKTPAQVTTPTTVTPKTTTPTTSTVKSYTMAEVKVANSAQKCWTAVSGKVYDLTPALTQHPGGKAAIMSLCGIDGTSAFTNQHGGQSNPMSMLNGLQIGILK